jgi:hypothetical protein
LGAVVAERMTEPWVKARENEGEERHGSMSNSAGERETRRAWLVKCHEDYEASRWEPYTPRNRLI